MILYFQYDNLGRVASYSEQLIETDILEQIQIDVEDEDLELIKQNYELTIINGELIIKKPLPLIDKEKQEEFLAQKEEFMEKANNGTVTIDDITNLLSKII